MDPARWQTLDSLLEQLLEQPPGERDALLRRLAAGDERLEQELRSLMRTDQAAAEFLERSALEVAALAVAARDIADAPEIDDPRIGTTVSHYRVLRRLGAGAMGEVYQAEDARLHRFVALKFLTDDFGREPDALSRFRREARAVSALNHPNICTIYDIGEQDGRPFHVMEYLDGVTLQARIAAGALPLDEVVSIGRQIADALDAAHRAGIVHRDIKPANIVLTAGEQVKVLDFGLALLRTADDEVKTQHDVRVGTPVYMSPEQASGGRVDTRTDLFSFGLVLYEMATGCRATAGADLARDLPPGLREVVARCVERDQERRYQHASEIRTDLGRLAAGTPLRGFARARSAFGGTWRVWTAGALAAAAFGGVIAARHWSTRTGLPFGDRNSIVLADFANATGDAVFDGTLREGVAVQLAQSPVLSVMPDDRVRHTLRLMGRPPDVRVDRATANEICERTGGAAVLEGSIAPLGSAFVLGLHAIDCSTGAVIDAEQSQAARKEDVLTVLAGMVTRFRTRAGESLATVARHNTPLVEATTGSLEALKAYSTGWRTLASAGDAAALPFFERAVDLDAGFAMAHAMLGRIYGDIGEGARSLSSTETAYRLRKRTSDRERFWIETSYDTQVTENLHRAETTCRLWEQTYPLNVEPHLLLAGVILPVLGQYEEAVLEADRALALDPDFSIAYYQLAERHLALGQLQQARAALDRTSGRQLDIPEFVLARYDLGFLEHDTARIQGIAALGERSDDGDEMLHKEALAAAFAGRIRQSRELARRASELAREHGDPERAAQFDASASIREALVGNFAQARRLADGALTVSNDRPVEYGAGITMALAGDVGRASAIADDLARRFPDDLSVHVSYVPVLRGLVGLKRGDAMSAIDQLNVAIPYDLSAPRVALHAYFGALYPAYVRGLAYLAARDGVRAAAEFQKILDHAGIVAEDPIGAFALLQRARALALAGQRDAARSAYRTFLDAWKAADSDVPLLADARAEYAHLR